MRPTRQETDLEFWARATEYWNNMLECYFLLDDRDGEARATERLYRAELALQEAQGLIEVYTGRPKPEWAV